MGIKQATKAGKQPARSTGGGSAAASTTTGACSATRKHPPVHRPANDDDDESWCPSSPASTLVGSGSSCKLVGRKCTYVSLKNKNLRIPIGRSCALVSESCCDAYSPQLGVVL